MTTPHPPRYDYLTQIGLLWIGLTITAYSTYLYNNDIRFWHLGTAGFFTAKILTTTENTPTLTPRYTDSLRIGLAIILFTIPISHTL